MAYWLMTVGRKTGNELKATLQLRNMIWDNTCISSVV